MSSVSSDLFNWFTVRGFHSNIGSLLGAKLASLVHPALRKYRVLTTLMPYLLLLLFLIDFALKSTVTPSSFSYANVLFLRLLPFFPVKQHIRLSLGFRIIADA